MTWTRSDVSRRGVAKTDMSRRSPWTKAEIRQARQTPLKPVLEALGYQLEPLRNGNYRLCRLAADIVVKDHYWVNKGDGAAGNAIDFLVDVQGMTFSQAMDLLCSVAGLPVAS